MTDATLLASTSLAEGLSEAQLPVLAALATFRTFAHGEVILASEDTHYPLVVILSGECDVLGVMDDTISRLHQGTVVGEVSFIDGKERSAKVVAHGPCEIAEFPNNLVSHLAVEHPAISSQLLLNIAKVLCAKLRAATRWIDASQE